MAESGGTLGRIRVELPIMISAVASFCCALTYWFWLESGSIKETLIFFGAGLAAVGQLAVAFYTARILTLLCEKMSETRRATSRLGPRRSSRESLIEAPSSSIWGALE
jgi:uncharacterized membrane protein